MVYGTVCSNMGNIGSDTKIKKCGNRFTVIGQGITMDKNLDLRDIGLLVKLLSLPDDWVFSTKGMCSIVKNGESSLRAGLSHLEEYGYLRRSRERLEHGHVGRAVWEITDTPWEFSEQEAQETGHEPVGLSESQEKCGISPDVDFPQQENPHEENPHEEKPHVGKPHEENHALLNTNKQITKTIKNESDIITPKFIIKLYKEKCPSLVPQSYVTRKITDIVSSSDFSKDDYVKAFENAESSTFLNGTDTSFRASLSWILSNMRAVIDGRYSGCSSRKNKTEKRSWERDYSQEFFDKLERDLANLQSV